MRVIKRELYNVSRADVFRLVPLADTHIGAASCNEAKLRQAVQDIKDDPNAYWVHLGDMCEFINLRDPRFQPGVLADWVKTSDLSDLAAAQRDRFLEIVEPIAGKCLALVSGNHEGAIQKHYERSVFGEIVTSVKAMAGLPADFRLGIETYGWLLWRFYWADSNQGGSCTVTVNMHHGFTAGKLAGAKALNLERWLWTHAADLVIFGHAHDELVKPVTVHSLDRRGRLVAQKRRGLFAGTFLETVNEDGPPTYAEGRGFFPTSTGCPEAWIKPGARQQANRVRVLV